MKKILLSVVIFVSALIAVSQISKQEAVSIVINQIVNDRVDSVNVYMESTIQTSLYYVVSPYDSIQVPYNHYWMFFVDQYPEYLWGHECYYVFINSNSGSFTIIQKQLPPFQYNLFLEKVSTPILMMDTPLYSNPNSYIPSPWANINNGKYALLFCGNDGGSSIMWNALSHSYSSLIEFGYPKENIFVLSHDGEIGEGTNISLDLDNDNFPDILPVPCSAYNLDSIFNHLSTVVTESDILYVFATTHGYRNRNESSDSDDGNVSFVLWQQELLSDKDFADMVAMVNCSQMIFNIFTCYAGGFVNEIMSMSNQAYKTILTCQNSIYPYLRVSNFSDVAAMDKYNFLTCSSLRGGYPSGNHPWYSYYDIGSLPYFLALFPNHYEEIDFDLLINGGNNNGIQEMGEVIKFTNEYDDQFSAYGSKIYNCGFKEDLLSLRGISGNVDTSQIIHGSLHIEDTLSVNSGVSLCLANNTKLNLYDAYFVVCDSANLVVNDSTSFIAKSGNCKIYFNGNIQLNTNINFIAENDASLDVYYGNSSNIEIHDAIFTNCSVHIECNDTIFINNCTFNNSNNLDIVGNAIVEESNFVQTRLYFDYVNEAYSGFVIIDDCFIINDSLDGIVVNNYPSYCVSNNYIEANECNGIAIYNSGFDITSTSFIDNNNINLSYVGVLSYSSYGSIRDNTIWNNVKGISLMNVSSMSVIGNNTIQQIYDNIECEVYASGIAFPAPFRYNSIVDEDNNGNPSDPLLYYNASAQSFGALLIDISCNFWGNNFISSEDLYPANRFSYLPFMIPGNSFKNISDIEQLYNAAGLAVEKGKYNVADSVFKVIIKYYPQSSFASASMIRLLALEEKHCNNFYKLKEYYQSINDSVLLKLSNILINKCDEKNMDWQSAIAWYENIIINHESIEDSIFAVIDLESLYLRMSPLKFVGNMKEHVPESIQDFVTNRNYLLSLLPEQRVTGTSAPSEYPPVQDVSVENNGENFITVSWNYPQGYPIETEILSWCQSEHGDFVGASQFTGDFVHRFEPEDIQNYVGWTIKSIIIIPREAEYQYSVKVWTGDTFYDISEIIEQPLDEPIYNEENTVSLSTGVVIEANKEVVIGFHTYTDIYWGYPVAIDNGPVIQGKGDLYKLYINGYPTQWESFYETSGINSNFYVKAIVQSPTGDKKILGAKVPVSNKEEILSGYNVYRDNELVCEITDYNILNYSEDLEDAQNVLINYCVSAVYGENESEKECASIYLSINDSHEITTLSVYPNPANTEFNIEGDNIVNIKIYSMTGQLVYEDKSSLQKVIVNTADFTAGIYFVKATDNNGVIFGKKIIVAK